TLAQAVNLALGELLDTYPGMCVFGEDVGPKGGVYGVTKGLQRRFGSARVFDTLLDEQSILGVALGGGLTGLLPVPEIQYLAYLHNAEDQIRGEAATQQFFSAGQFRNPMVVRVAGYAYQKGFGGHFHNDNAVGVLRDIPGLVIASPARPDDAAAMLRTCLASAAVDGSVCVFLEPIALYHTRDLHDEGDGGWLAPYPEAYVPLGQARTYGDGGDLTMVTFGNGLRMSLRAARRRRAAGGAGHRPGAGGGRDPARRRGLRGSRHRPGRRWVPGPDRAGDQRGQLHSARPGRAFCAAGRADDREGRRRSRARRLRTWCHFRQNRWCVTPLGLGTTSRWNRSRSSSGDSQRCSPVPSLTGDTTTCMVSTRSASRNCRMVVTPPPSRMSWPCAASWACPRIVAGSPSTKWNVVSESVNDGRLWWVMTNTGVRNGGSSPHQPRHSWLGQGPRWGPNLFRPMISAPM